tara:strand:+ start:287 stop:565 length:279 start_codon:yes stop_codon:yes gene_type:complete
MKKMNKKKLKTDDKKTDFPDLERLPYHNRLKHFVYVLLNIPRWFIEDLYEKYFLKEKIELEETKLKLQQKELELNILKNQLEEVKLNILTKY